jgi:hypothetical protein
VNGIVSDESTTGTYEPRAEYLYFEVEVETLSTEYPESGERTRKWVCPHHLQSDFLRGR